MTTTTLDVIPDLVDEVMPAVAHVDVVADQGQGNGSGFIASSDGERSFVVTNAHVVEPSAKHSVDLRDGKQMPAAIRGIHPVVDIAVLELPAGGLPTLPFREAGETRVGETVIAVGSPHGLHHSVTAGIVSGLDRVRTGPNQMPCTMLQSDAATIYGNSGGPLIGLDGQVVAVNSQIHVESYGLAPGINYAIPARSARLAYDAILDAPNGEVARPILGVPIQDAPVAFDPEGREKWGQRGGALVNGLPVADSPAAAAGFERGDVIIKVDGYVIDDPGDLFTWLLDPACLEGKTEAIVVRRGRRKRLSVQPVPLRNGTG